MTTLPDRFENILRRREDFPSLRREHGGYPLAYECGVNFMSMILNNAGGKANPVIIGNYVENRSMFKYNGICIRDETGLV